MPKFAIVPPDRFSLGRRIRKSSPVSRQGRGFAPARRILLWEYFGGSVKAAHTASLASIGSLNKLSKLDLSILEAVDGRATLTQSVPSASIG